MTSIKTIQTVLIHLLPWLALFLLHGCSSQSFFINYTTEASKQQGLIRSGHITKAAKAAASRIKTADGLLYAQESGRLYQLAGHYNKSRQAFDNAIERYQSLDNRAKVSVSDMGAKGLSLLGNDNAIPYQGNSVERTLVHHFQALNYLFEGDLAGANVELRRAQHIQKQQQNKHEDTTEAAIKQADKEGIDTGVLFFSPRLKPIQKKVATLNGHYLNGYTYYLSAVLWEAQGKWNNALVDYKLALSLDPLNQQLLADIKRAQNRQSIKKPTVVIFYEQGSIAQKSAFTLHLPSPSGSQILSISLPFYDPTNWPKQRELTATTENSTKRSFHLSTLSTLAAQRLQDDYPGILTRQVLRAVAKKQLHSELGRKSPIAGLVASAYSAVSEQADLRFWSTLPHSASVLRMTLSEGNLQLTLKTSTLEKTEELLLPRGSTTLVRVIDVGSQLITQRIQLN